MIDDVMRELEADATLEADYIILHVLLGTGNPERLAKAARYILQHQNEDGGWGIYFRGPSNISASVKCYFGLKLAGYAADYPDLVRARKKILQMGGVTEVNTFTKIYLCFFGQYDYDAVPPFRPRLFSFPSGSGSTSTKFLHGPGPFWCRCRFATPRNRSRRSPRSWGSKSCLWVGAKSRACIYAGTKSYFHGATSFCRSTA